jgi:predicted DNA-binding protein
MPTKRFKRFSLCVEDKTYESLTTIASKTGKSLADVSREMIKRGLASEWIEENFAAIGDLVEQRINIALKPHINRLAALNAKTAKMAGTSMYLNAQALVDLVPTERRRNIKELFDNAKKKAVADIRIPNDTWEEGEMLNE